MEPQPISSCDLCLVPTLAVTGTTQQRGWDSLRMELYQTLSTAELVSFRSCFGHSLETAQLLLEGRDKAEGQELPMVWGSWGGRGREKKREGR